MNARFLTHVSTRGLCLEVVLVTLATAEPERPTDARGLLKVPPFEVAVAFAGLDGLRTGGD